MKSELLADLMMQVDIEFRVMLYEPFMAIMHAADRDQQTALMLLDRIKTHPVALEADPQRVSYLVEQAFNIISA